MTETKKTYLTRADRRAKADSTTQAAAAIIAKEQAEREAKQARLRALRLAATDAQG